MDFPASEKVALIAVFLPIRRQFAYSYDNVEKEQLQPGVRVVVPFRNRDEVGVFIGFGKSDVKTKPIKSILDKKPLFTKSLVKLAVWCAGYYMCGIGEMFRIIGPRDSLKKKVTFKTGEKLPKRPSAQTDALLGALSKPLTAATLAGKTGLTIKELDRQVKPLIKSCVILKTAEYYFAASKVDPLKWEEVELKSLPAEKKVEHTAEQRESIRKICVEMEKQSGRTTLLHGVTGSGKTEVYMSVCQKALASGGGAIVLVPEIALTYQLVRRFYVRFGRDIAILHSGLTPAQRRDEWMRIQKGDARLVIGARSAIFAPLAAIKCIIVDEENDSSYKQMENPAYNARDVAVMLGRITGAAVCLGSATPSLESFYNAKTGKYSLCELTHRIDNRPMPPVRLIRESDDAETVDRLLPTEVVEEMLDRIDRKEQSLVFINRRGFSPHLKCFVCGHVVECPNCSITLTVHAGRGGTVLCHYCGFETGVPKKCPECGIGRSLKYRGVGTQKLESFIKELFPKARVSRLDHDTAPSRERVFKILEEFETGKIDILIGTQMTAKGHDFANLTFTAIVNADDYLSFPDFRSAERTFSLVTQAAGRTGRSERGGEVVITAASDHYAIRHSVSHDYRSFYKDEIERRKSTGYPPFSRLIGILFDSASDKKLEAAMLDLLGEGPELPAGVIQLGPVPALIFKLRNRYRWKLMLKGGSSQRLHEAAYVIEKSVSPGINCSIDVDPLGFY